MKCALTVSKLAHAVVGGMLVASSAQSNFLQVVVSLEKGVKGVLSLLQRGAQPASKLRHGASSVVDRPVCSLLPPAYVAPCSLI
jgi:hypothetical protein